jgi:cathepsin D
MRFTLATSIVALAVLTAAAPQPGVQNLGVAIPITKRSGLTNADKSVNARALKYHVASAKAYVVFFFLCFASIQAFLHSKVLRGFKNFEQKTGGPHPAALKRTQIQSRATGADDLTNDNNQLWYGTISVGTPPKDFTGELSCTFNERTTHSF